MDHWYHRAATLKRPKKAKLALDRKIFMEPIPIADDGAQINHLQAAWRSVAAALSEQDVDVLAMNRHTVEQGSEVNRR